MIFVKLCLERLRAQTPVTVVHYLPHVRPFANNSPLFVRENTMGVGWTVNSGRRRCHPSPMCSGRENIVKKKLAALAAPYLLLSVFRVIWQSARVGGAISEFLHKY